jgi:hypothetical protein
MMGRLASSIARMSRSAALSANETFYRALSAGSIEGISAACAKDPDVTCLHETSTEVAVGWQAVLDSWKAVPFRRLLGIVGRDGVTGGQGQSRSRASWAWKKVRGKMKDGSAFAFTALGTNIYEKRGDKWLMVHHHASKAAEHLV